MQSGKPRSGSEVFPAEPAGDASGRSLVVAEQLTLLRDSVAALCELQVGVRIAAACEDGGEAMRAIREHEPDAAIVDLGIPVLGAHEILRRIREERLDTRVILLAKHADRRTILDTLRSGAYGFILKSDPGHCLVEALRHALNGSVCLSPAVRTNMLFTGPREQQEEEDPVDTLTGREHQVFCLLIQGVRAKEIASRLDLSAKTVDTYRASLMRKLGIHDLAGLVKFAISRNLTPVR